VELVTTSYKRLFVRCVRAEAQKRALTFLEVLTEYASAQVKATRGGITLIGSTGNGQASTLLPNAGEGLTPVAYAEMISDVLDRYDDSRAALIEGGTADPTDPQIVDRLLQFLIPVTEVRPDFSSMQL
jgi:hypothetical protein